MCCKLSVRSQQIHTHCANACEQNHGTCICCAYTDKFVVNARECITKYINTYVDGGPLSVNVAVKCLNPFISRDAINLNATWPASLICIPSRPYENYLLTLDTSNIIIHLLILIYIQTRFFFVLLFHQTLLS